MNMICHFGYPDFVITDSECSREGIEAYLALTHASVYDHDCYVKIITDELVEVWSTEPLPPQGSFGKWYPYAMLIGFMQAFHRGDISKKDFEGWFNAWQEGRIEIE
jgi:hypothetical protein